MNPKEAQLAGNGLDETACGCLFTSSAWVVVIWGNMKHESSKSVDVMFSLSEHIFLKK